MKLEELEKHVETREVEHLQIIAGYLKRFSTVTLQSITNGSNVTSQHECHKEYIELKENTRSFYGFSNEVAIYRLQSKCIFM